MDERVGTVELGLFHAPKAKDSQGVEARTEGHPLPFSSGCSPRLLGLEMTRAGKFRLLPAHLDALR